MKLDLRNGAIVSNVSSAEKTGEGDKHDIHHDVIPGIMHFVSE